MKYLWCLMCKCTQNGCTNPDPLELIWRFCPPMLWQALDSRAACLREAHPSIPAPVPCRHQGRPEFPGSLTPTQALVSTRIGNLLTRFSRCWHWLRALYCKRKPYCTHLHQGWVTCYRLPWRSGKVTSVSGCDWERKLLCRLCTYLQQSGNKHHKMEEKETPAYGKQVRFVSAKATQQGMPIQISLQTVTPVV